MPTRCCMCTGQTSASEGVYFHRLPQDGELRRQWLTVIGDVKHLTDTSEEKCERMRVCSKHFRPADFEDNLRARLMNIPHIPKLRDGAVPSVLHSSTGSRRTRAERLSPTEQTQEQEEVSPQEKRSRVEVTLERMSSSEPFGEHLYCF